MTSRPEGPPARRARPLPRALPVLVRFACGAVLANLLGASVVFFYAAVVVPDVPVQPGARDPVQVNATVLAAYLLVAFVLGSAWSFWRFRPVLQWLRAERPATPRERQVVLGAPGRQFVVNAVLWTVAVVLFTSLNTAFGYELARTVALASSLGAATTCALGYLISQQVLRPLMSDALDGRAPSEITGPRLWTRIMMAWAAGSGVPLVGVALAVAVRPGPGRPYDAPVLFLAVTGLLFGGAMTAATARGVSSPLREVQAAVSAVAQGRLDVRVRVDDPSELGLLQAGVNGMTAGLAERQQLQDLFGRQVGTDVARQALERGVRLGGEEREVAILFVDVVGSTQLAVERRAAEVVEVLNAFFTAVVDVVAVHGGFVNKFQGDAALAVFGAPVTRSDSARSALLAARELRDRLSEADVVSAGIGVSAGPVVAGNIGAAERYEYTVIGDAVNEAARLTELAKQTEHGLLASGRTIAAGGEGEARHWRRLGTVRLRGRTRETTVWGPARSSATTVPSTGVTWRR